MKAVRTLKSTLTITLLALAATTVQAFVPINAAKPAPKPAGLTAAVIANKDSYTLNPAQSGKDFRDKLAALKQKPGPAPATPAVDLVLRITNPTDKEITIPLGGDDSVIHLQLAGPKDGPVTIPNNVPMTMEFRIGKPITIAPGKTYDIKITSLSAGSRGISECSYWTEPGDYTLAATFTFSTDPGPQTTITSAAKLKITK